MEVLKSYWSGAPLLVNGLLLLHLLGATAVGLLLGYERTYHGRAAGMRTYTLVCVASTMLTAIAGYPAEWYGGLVSTPVAGDPTRIIQGIVTGIGFLGAGVIMREGFTIRGLSTAASIWMTAAIGVLIGVGFYGAAIGSTVVTVLTMMSLGSVEKKLPHQTTRHLTVTYPNVRVPSIEEMRAMMREYGFEMIDWSIDYHEGERRLRWDLILQADGSSSAEALVVKLTEAPDVVEFSLAPARS